MRVSVYDTVTGEIVKVVTAGSLDTVLANLRPGQEISEDDTPAGLDDRSMAVDPKTGMHRAKTENEHRADAGRRKSARDRMWAKEMADREAHRQRVIASGVDEAVAGAIMEGIYGREKRVEDDK